MRDLDPLRLDAEEIYYERSCRFPVGEAPEGPEQASDQLFCGDEAEEGCPYCGAHRAKAWRGTPAGSVEALMEKKPQRRAA